LLLDIGLASNAMQLLWSRMRSQHAIDIAQTIGITIPSCLWETSETINLWSWWWLLWLWMMMMVMIKDHLGKENSYQSLCEVFLEDAAGLQFQISFISSRTLVCNCKIFFLSSRTWVCNCKFYFFLLELGFAINCFMKLFWKTWRCFKVLGFWY